jgi:hypothetical protein
MAGGRNRKKTKKVKAAVKVRPSGKMKKVKKAGTVSKPKKVKRKAKKIAKRATKKAPRRKVPSAAKAAALVPTAQDLAPSGEPEFVSNDPLVKP